MIKTIFAAMLALALSTAPASVAFADQPNQNAGGGSGNSGPGDKSSPKQGPPEGCDHGFPGNEDEACD